MIKYKLKINDDNTKTRSTYYTSPFTSVVLSLKKNSRPILSIIRNLYWRSLSSFIRPRQVAGDDRSGTWIPGAFPLPHLSLSTQQHVPQNHHWQRFCCIAVMGFFWYTYCMNYLHVRACSLRYTLCSSCPRGRVLLMIVPSVWGLAVSGPRDRSSM
jgi:hypothetical protein